MDVGFQGDSVKLNMALSACLLGYGEVGLWLVNESKRPGSWVVMDESKNPYVPWIRDHSGQVFRDAVEIGLGALRANPYRFSLNLDDITATIEDIGSTTPITEEVFEQWAEIWKKCVMFEKGFWDMALAVGQGASPRRPRFRMSTTILGPAAVPQKSQRNYSADYARQEPCLQLHNILCPCISYQIPSCLALRSSQNHALAHLF